jgi:Peptidase family M23
MSPDKAKKIILVSVIGMVVITIAGDAVEGKSPKPARFLALGFIILLLVGGAELAPPVAAAFAMVAVVAVALERLGPIATRVAGVVGGRVPLGSLSPTDTPGSFSAIDSFGALGVDPSSTVTPSPTMPTDAGSSGAHVIYPFSKHYPTIGVPGQGTHNGAPPFNNWESSNAVDLAAPCNTPVLAVQDGRISLTLGFGSLGSSGRTEGLRLHLVTKTNTWYYGHLFRFAPGIIPGVHVKQGAVIGYSGRASGVCHLHIASKSGNPKTLLGA